MQEFEALAKRLADEAGEIVRPYFRKPMTIEIKGDDSPVTIADRAVEKRMREIIEAERPDDGIYGEEFGIKESKNGLTWVLDPIDGTSSFIIGRPTFGTLIALCEDGVPQLGVINQPILGEQWIGDGKTTTFNGKVVRARPCDNIDRAIVGSTCPAMFKGNESLFQSFDDRCKMIWGGDCYMYGLMAQGYLDIIFETLLQPYDYCALVPVVKGAGGHISDYAGNDLTLESDGTVVACGDPGLWPDVQKLLAQS